VKGRVPFSCSDVRYCAAAWLDEQLSPAESEFMEQHLNCCPECEDFVGALAEQDFSPPNVKLIEQDHFWDTMDQALEEEFLQSNQREQQFSRAALIVYAAALVLSVLWGVHHRQRAIHLERIVDSQQQSLEHWERITQQAESGKKTVQPVKYVPARMEL
jgi:hypothetical protein